MTSSKPRILVVDDQYARSATMRTNFLTRVGLSTPDARYDVYFCSGQDAGHNSLPVVLERVRDGWPPGPEQPFWSLILLDVQFEGTPLGPRDGEFGFELLEALRKELGSALPVVMLTSDDPQRRSRSARTMADGYLPKDENFLNAASLDDAVEQHGYIEDGRPPGERLVGRSFALLSVLREARRYARLYRTNPNVGSRIIYGETGTGKTELAKYIHAHSRRAGKYIKWTAEGRNEDIVKDTLFGRWKGAHSMAEDSAPGRIEMAHGGTFLLDEVANLLRTVQPLFMEARRRDPLGLRTIRRMGNFPRRRADVEQARRSVLGLLQDDESIKVDVLLLSATNKDLRDERLRRRLGFMKDLLSDLGDPIDFPSLNDRRDDIPLLFGELLTQARKDRPTRIDTGVLENLKDQDWTERNVVGLKKIAERAAASLGSDFDDLYLHHIGPGAGSAKPPAKALDHDDVQDSSPEGAAQAPDLTILKTTAMQTLDRLVEGMLLGPVPADQDLLKGALPRLQEAYARLVLRMFGAALRATRRSSGMSTLEAVRLLLDRKEFRPGGRGDATKAYDVVKRLVLLADTTFSRRGARGCPVLSDDEVVKEQIRKAIKR